MLWRTAGDWTYETFALDEPDGSFGDFAAFIGLWRSVASPNVPDWKVFSVDVLKPWWGWVCVLDAIPDEPLSFRVRLWGSNVARALDYDMTGHVLSPADAADIHDSKHVTLDDLEYARHILDNRLLGFAKGPLDVRYGMERLYAEAWVPLSSDGGNTLDKLMHASRVVETPLP